MGELTSGGVTIDLHPERAKQAQDVPLEEAMKATAPYLPPIIPPDGPTLPTSPMDENDPAHFGPNQVRGDS